MGAGERRVLITGGAGFVGANLAVALRGRHPDWDVVALDNLRRRGSELNLPRLRAAGVRFEHGDVRAAGDLLALPRTDAIVECSAEPSALAGVDGATDYAVSANLMGAWHCLELARRDGAQMVFLSTSRVYPVAALNALALDETPTRFDLSERQPIRARRRAGSPSRSRLTARARSTAPRSSPGSCSSRSTGLRSASAPSSTAAG